MAQEEDNYWIMFQRCALMAQQVDVQARSQTFLWGGSNRSNLGTFYDYAWIILRSR